MEKKELKAHLAQIKDTGKNIHDYMNELYRVGVVFTKNIHDSRESATGMKVDSFESDCPSHSDKVGIALPRDGVGTLDRK